MSGFRDLVAAVEQDVFLDTDYFAEMVTVHDESNNAYAVASHVVYRTREEDGVVIETLTVRLAKAGLASAPGNGWRLYRVGDTRAFVYRYQAGSETDNRWRCIFERRTQKRQAAKAA